MIIDSGQIENGISVGLLAKLIQKHEKEYERFNKLNDYYIGKHEILRRQKKSKGVANNKIVCNHAKYITDITTAYIVGNPISYAASEGFDIEEIKNAYIEQDIESLDSRIVKETSIYGRTYELIYATEESTPQSALINPRNAFVAYSNECTNKAILGVYYYKIYDIDGHITGIVCNVYTIDKIYKYKSDYDNWNSLTLIDEEEHYFGIVPLIEYKNDDERIGDYEQCISQIDAYNILQSDRVNDKEQFVDSFLFLRNIEIDSEQAKELKQERILMGEEDATAQYLSKVMSEQDIKVLRDDIKEDIHCFSMVPNLSDENFANNISGVAIKYKLISFEQHIKIKERFIVKSLKQRFKAYNNYLIAKGKMKLVPVHKIDIIFTHNLPVNNAEIAQMIRDLSDNVTQETLINQLDFVTDAEEEAKLAREQRIKRQRDELNIIHPGNVDYNIDDEE